MSGPTRAPERVTLRPPSGPTWAVFGPFGWNAVECSTGELLVRRGYAYGDMPPRFKTGEAAVAAAPRMFARVFAEVAS